MELLQLQELCIFHRTRKDITMQIRKYMAQLAALILLLPVFGGCSRPAQEDAVLNRYSRTSFDLFDTVTVITGFDTSEQAFETKADWLLQLLEEYHQLYDIYHDYDGINNLKTVNDHAGLEPVAVDARIIDMLEYSREMYTLTQGMTNIAMGSVLSIWHTYREAGIEDPEHASLPDRAELEAAAQHMDIDSVVIDRDRVFAGSPDAAGRRFHCQRICYRNGCCSCPGNGVGPFGVQRGRQCAHHWHKRGWHSLDRRYSKSGS